ncbi:MAG: DMT family transporter [Bacillota bacterium]|nr:DMT family transporter [Bacillota bacterium]
MTDYYKKRKAMAMMAICAVMWSLGGIFIKLITWNPMLIAGSRSIISAMIIGAYMLYTKRPVKLCRYSFGAGAGLSLSCICFVAANKLTTAANAIVLQYAAPVFILIMTACIFKEKLHKKEIIVVGCSMAGIVLFFFDQLSPGSVMGNILGILAGIFLALMFVMTGQGGSDDSIRMSGILFAHCMTAIIGFPIGIATTVSVSGTEVLYVMILGVFQLGIPYVIYAIASRYCPPLACSLIGMLEPLFNPVWVAIFIGEMPGPFALTGAAVIIVTVTSWCISESRITPVDKKE